MTPSPFEIAQAVSSNISGAFEQQRDMSSIDRILGEANRQGTPGAVDNAMAQILSRVSPQNQERAIALLQGKQKQMQLQQQQINQQQQQQAKLDEQRAFDRKKLEEQRTFDQTKSENKPTMVETAQLKDIGERSLKIDSTIRDLRRAKKIAQTGVTGPIKGGKFDLPVLKFFKPEDIQDLEGISARLLVGGFSTLPRILSEFESFKVGQISKNLSPKVLLRNVNVQLAAAELEQRNLQRMQQLQDQGMSEVESLRQVIRESAAEEQAIINTLSSGQGNNQQSPQESRESSLDKMIFG